ncbi:MAG: ParA family protein [Deltaproteobacteria bacterium]|nr:ParA family protein [Deltaproteobacteria bacterium]
MMVAQPTTCSVCGTRFVPRFVYQTETAPDGPRSYCSVVCRVPELRPGYDAHTADLRCSVCDQRFSATYAYQLVTVRGTPRHVCSEACRGLLLHSPPMTGGRPRSIAVQSAKGGTGKTTAAVSIAAGFALQGQRVLLIDIDPQGGIALSFDLHPPSTLTLFDRVVGGEGRSNEAVVSLRRNLHVLPTDPFAPSLEAELASGAAPERRFASALDGLLTKARYDVVIFDCPPSDGLLNACVRRLVAEVLMPISCDYLALAACKRALRGLSREIRATGHSLALRLLPTFYDPRNESSVAALRALEDYAPGHVLPPIRTSRKVVDAPRHRKTIFEHARTSTAAKDFLLVVARLTAPLASQDAA